MHVMINGLYIVYIFIFDFACKHIDYQLIN